MREGGRKLSKEKQVGPRRRVILLLGKGWHEDDIAGKLSERVRSFFTSSSSQ